MNCDLGEVTGNWSNSHEAPLIGVVSSANVACGGHAGDAESMLAVCRAAARHGVAVGAQVSYPDREGFGRRFIDIGSEVLFSSLRRQFDDLERAASRADTHVTYIKPHGALYNAIVTNDVHAQCVVDLARARSVPLLGLPGSRVERLARDSGVEFVVEFFADRNYTAQGTLVPRIEPDALVTDPGVAARRVGEMLTHRRVTANTGHVVTVHGRSVCVHSDTNGAEILLTTIRQHIAELGWAVKAFTATGDR
ncbi:MAG: 5-oxoprolinase subunit PxpA [Ilumatobacteraceae bacterium]